MSEENKSNLTDLEKLEIMLRRHEEKKLKSQEDSKNIKVESVINLETEDRVIESSTENVIADPGNKTTIDVPRFDKNTGLPLQKKRYYKLKFSNKGVRISLKIFTVLLIIGFLTNPSDSDFKSYLSSQGIGNYEKENIKFGRSSYYFIFSIFTVREYRHYDLSSNRKRYIGFLNNFIEITD